MRDYLKQEIFAERHRLYAVQQSIIISEKKGIDIYRSALDRLRYDGFNLEELGTEYIAKLIFLLYHERSLLEMYYKRPGYQGYWDLSNDMNSHYKLLGNTKNKINNIRLAIEHSTCEENDADINELIYDLTDLEIRRYCEDSRPRDEQTSYKKLLLK